jgi:glycosyltransferase involved in cell wall biosynthesis
MTGEVHVVVPDGIDDPTRPSGGNVYDRRLCEELTRSGWTVREHEITATLTDVLAGLADGSLVLVDGLVAVAAPHAVLDERDRLTIIVLLHMPFGERDVEVRLLEQTVLGAAVAVVTTSTWTRQWVLEHYAIRPDRIHVAEPGVDPADLVPGRDVGGNLLCVAAVTFDKGHDVLLEALAEVADRPWRLTCVGSLDRDREFVERVQRLAVQLGIDDRVTWTGALVGGELDKAYAAADVLVLASRAESWGMVVGEALARGIPVLATEVGGLPEALGPSEELGPGLLVPAGDVSALADVLRRWLGYDALRHDMRTAARARRATLDGWPVTAERVARVLTEVVR